MTKLLSYIVSNETEIRLGVFLSMLLCMAIWEMVSPCRRLTQEKTRRWLNNLGLVILNSMLLRLLLPVAVTGAAAYATKNDFGLLNNLQYPQWISILIALIVLDLVIYIQHVAFHKYSVLWRIHRAHHTDLDFDVTTGLRFHPIEMIFSMIIKFVAVLLLGAPVSAVILFEVILNGASIFNHGNVKLPQNADRLIRLLFVTPDMHRVHHSACKQETDSNYGFSLSIWDRLFGSYRDQPKAGHRHMTIGLENPRETKHCVPLLAILKTPFFLN